MTDEPLDLIWGGRAIATELRLRPKQFYGMLYQGDLDGVVHRIGKGTRKRLVASRRALRRHFAPQLDV